MSSAGVLMASSTAWRQAQSRCSSSAVTTRVTMACAVSTLRRTLLSTCSSVTSSSPSYHTSWYEGEEDVTLEQVLSNVRRNVETAQAIVTRVVTALDEHRDCACRHAVEFAINTPAELIPQGTKDKLDLLICLLYTSDDADDLTRVDLGGRR